MADLRAVEARRISFLGTTTQTPNEWGMRRSFLLNTGRYIQCALHHWYWACEVEFWQQLLALGAYFGGPSGRPPPPVSRVPR
ncbi:MAG: hypothetical protein NVSMB1_09020 [Polyangiales bacterium]